MSTQYRCFLTKLFQMIVNWTLTYNYISLRAKVWEYTPFWSLQFPQHVPVHTWQANARCPSSGSCFHGQWEDWSSLGLQCWALGFPEEDQGWQWSLTIAWSEWTVSHVGHTCAMEMPLSCMLVGRDSTLMIEQSFMNCCSFLIPVQLHTTN